MKHEDIGAMIAHALDALEEPKRSGGLPLVHQRHIVDQYVALCHEGETKDPDPSTAVAIPIAPGGGAAGARTSRFSELVRRAFTRRKR